MAAAVAVPSVHPPIQLFAAAIGIGGLGLAWRLAAHVFSVTGAIGEAVLALAAAVFVVVTFRYGVKFARAPALVRAELADPIASSFAGAVGIAISIFAVGALPYSHGAALALWIAGAATSMATLVALLGRWIVAKHELTHASPAWFIPIVGNAVAAYVAVPLGFAEAGWFLFSAATLCWLAMQPIVLYRLIVGDRIAPKAAPSLAVLVSSPAVLANAWFVLDGGVVDPVFRILTFKALFFAIVVVRVLHLARGGGFSFAWWGYTFPAAALAAALVRYAGGLPSPFASALALGALALASLVTAYVALRSGFDAMRRIPASPRAAPPVPVP